jgi:hypothetical protein
MSNPFLRDFDDLLQTILTDYGNLDPSPDTTAGSIVYIKAACLASMLWGLYRYQDYLSKQIFPDTADSDNLNHHGYVYGIGRKSGESDSDYLARILAFIQQPPAGGNRKDFETWTTSTPAVAGVTGSFTIASATVQIPGDLVSPAVPPGNVDIVCLPNDESILGTTGMRDLVYAAYTGIEGVRPVTANQVHVYEAIPQLVPIEVKVVGPIDVTVGASDIAAYMATLKPGDPLYKSKVESLCIEDGAISATMLSPAGDILPAPHYVIRSNGTPNVHF